MRNPDDPATELPWGTVLDLCDRIDSAETEIRELTTVSTRQKCSTHNEWFSPRKGCPWCKLDAAERKSNARKLALYDLAVELSWIRAERDKYHKWHKAAELENQEDADLIRDLKNQRDALLTEAAKQQEGGDVNEPIRSDS